MFTLFLKNREFKNQRGFDFFFNFKFQNQLEKSQDTPSGGLYIYVVHLIKHQKDR